MAPNHVWYIYGKDANGELHPIIVSNGKPMFADNEYTARELGKSIVEEYPDYFVGYAISQLY